MKIITKKEVVPYKYIFTFFLKPKTINSIRVFEEETCRVFQASLELRPVASDSRFPYFRLLRAGVVSPSLALKLHKL